MENYYSKIEVLKRVPIWRRAKVVLLCCLVGLLALDVQAQSRTVSGKVTAADDGSALPGVTLVIKGSTTGTVTDIDGNYKVEVSSDDAVLVASFVGYTSMEQVVGNASILNFDLQVDVETLDEVVVVGYGTQKKSDLTGAVASVKGDELLGSVTASVDQALQGRVAGVQVTQNSGQPGGAVSIRIRGTTSLTGSSEPLYVIDGIQIGGDAGGISGFDWQGGAGGQQANVTNPLASINPADIESVEVLKDASATAIYGSRGANGVVIITTKSGKKGKASVEYSGFYSVQQVGKLHDMMDLRQFADYNNEVAGEVNGIEADPRFADPSLLGPGTDWQEAVFRVAPMQSHTISLKGATEDLNYYLSGGYFQQEGIMIGSEFDRFNLRAKVEGKVIDRVKLGGNINYTRKDEVIIMNDSGDGVISQALNMSPAVPVRNFRGEFAGPDTQFGGNNPVALALVRNNTVLEDRIMANFFADLEIIEGLTFRTELSVDMGTSLNKAFIPSYEWGEVINPTSQLGQRNSLNFSWQWRNYATYTRNFGSHGVTVVLGTEAQRSDYEGFTAYKINLPDDIPNLNQGDQSTLLPDGYKGWSSLNSYFARLNYSYDDKYLFTGTIRRDGSSKFGPNNSWGLFPSASVAWRISNEGFLAQSSVISNLKLRLSYGTVGNQAIGDYTFGSALETQITEFGTGVRPARYSNPNVQWESTASTNIAIDLALFGGRVDLTVDAYDKQTENLLLDVNLPDIYGSIIGAPQANVGSMTNRGVEISLGATPVDNGNFLWKFNGNLTMNRNEVTKLSGDPLTRNLYWYSGFQDAIITDEGHPVGQFYGYVMDGIFTTEQEILDHAVQIPDPSYVPADENDPGVNLIERTTGLWLGDVRWRDLNGDGRITPEDQTIIGDPNPDFTYGFNNTFSYGPFALEVYVIGAQGGDILNYSKARNESMNAIWSNQSVTVVNRARTELIDPAGDPNDISNLQLTNPDTNIPRFDNGGENNNHVKSTRWIEDGSYIRVQNIKLSYTFPRAIIERASMSNAVVYANVQNPFTFTKYSGLDPQVGAFNQDPLYQNVDMGRYPLATVFTFGVNVGF